MPRRVLFSARAQTWLHREVAYLAERSFLAARRLLKRIAETRRQLAAFPRSSCPGLVPGTRRLVVAPYLLTYRERGEILRSSISAMVVNPRRLRPATSKMASLEAAAILALARIRL